MIHQFKLLFITLDTDLLYEVLLYIKNLRFTAILFTIFVITYTNIIAFISFYNNFL